jgi:magnesium transporter
MLIARPAEAQPTTLDLSTGHVVAPQGTVWFDLIDPTDVEHAYVQKVCGVRVPSRSDLDEIESSSRSYRENGTLYLSTPLLRREGGQAFASPLGIVVSEHVLVTIRYAEYPSFDTYAGAVAVERSPLQPDTLLVGLLEVIVDRLADVLEIVGAHLDEVSTRIFHTDEQDRSKRADERLRGLLKGIGRQGDTVSLLRSSLLGLSRMVLFVDGTLGTGSDKTLHARLKTIGRDLQSLTEYDSQITSKVQFLLDATLGLINIEQNNGIRILTVVSLIGIPPTLIASIYGMNFKNIPELSWSFGYWYALLLMLASVVLPLAWFRRLGWI